MREPFKLKLDRERELRFGTHSAIYALGRECGINVDDPATYRFPLRPDVTADFIWAGQLWDKNPLRREEVAQYLPTEYSASLALTAQVYAEILAQRGVSPKPADAS